MTGPLILQLVITVVMLVASTLAGAAAARAKLEQERRHWSIEQSIFLVGAGLACVTILGGLQ
jgi:hypothetical protein